MYVCMYAEAIYVCIYVLRKYVVYMYVCMYVCMYNFIITDEQRHTCQQNHRDGHPNTGWELHTYIHTHTNVHLPDYKWDASFE